MIWSLRSVNTDKYFKQLRKVNVGVQWTCPSRHPMPFDKPLNLSLEHDAIESSKKSKQCDPE